MADPKIAELLAKAKELGVNDEAQARKIIKDNKVRSFKKLGEIIAKMATAGEKKSGAAKRVRKSTGIIHSEGPRGFKMGPVWLASIKSLKGIALSPSNLPKLKKTAESKGIDTEGKTQEELAAAIAKTL